MDWLWEIFRDVSTSLTWLVGLTLAFSILFHVLFLKVWRLNIKQWKLVEYAWVLFAFLSAIGLVDESRRFQAEVRVMSERAEMERALASVENWFENYQAFACEDVSFSLPEHDPKLQSCVAFGTAATDLMLIQNTGDEIPIIPPALANGLDAALDVIEGNPLPGEERDIRDARIADYMAARANYLETQAATQRSELQQGLILLVPFLFSIAIALKVTKVTGEYRETK